MVRIFLSNFDLGHIRRLALHPVRSAKMTAEECNGALVVETRCRAPDAQIGRGVNSFGKPAVPSCDVLFTLQPVEGACGDPRRSFERGNCARMD